MTAAIVAWLALIVGFCGGCAWVGACQTDSETETRAENAVLKAENATLKLAAIQAIHRAGTCDEMRVMAEAEADRARSLLHGESPSLPYTLPTAPRRPRIEA